MPPQQPQLVPRPLSRVRARRSDRRVSTPEPPSTPAAAGAPPSAEHAAPQPLPLGHGARRGGRRPSTWQPWLYVKIGARRLLVIAYAIAFVVENSKQINVDFVFADANVRLIWTMLLLLALGIWSAGAALAAIPPPAPRAARQEGPQAGRCPRDLVGRDEAEGKPR